MGLFDQRDSQNPMLRGNMISRVRGDATQADLAQTMTVSGTINKAGILFIIMLVGGHFGWNAVESLSGSGLAMAGGIIGFILAIALTFIPRMAPFLAPAYALAQGTALGYISCLFDVRFPGIAANAMFLTFGTLGLMLALYRLNILRATPIVQRIVMVGMFAIMATYIADMVMGFFGHHVNMIHEASPIGIGFSLIVVGIAALNLTMDFGQIERVAAARMPKYMEWYCGFSLLITLVWLYMEMLRLLSKLSNRR